MTDYNPCIETVTVTTTKVVKGKLRSPIWSGTCLVEGSGKKAVQLDIDKQWFGKNDLVWLAARLIEISEAL